MQNSSFRIFFVLSVLLPTGGVCGAASIVYTTNRQDGQIIYGCPILYSLKDLAGPVQSYAWQYRRTGACTTLFGPTTATNNDSTEGAFETKPGTFEIRCTIIYAGTSGGPPPVASEAPTLAITIPPPDGVRISSGDNVVKALGHPNPTNFQITCKGIDVCHAEGLAQEMVTNARGIPNRKYPNGTPLTPKQKVAWGPPTDPHPLFYLIGTTISDSKQAGDSYRNQLALPGTQLFTGTQQLRLVITDGCGNRTPYPLKPAFTVTDTKKPDNTYIITHTQQ